MTDDVLRYAAFTDRPTGGNPAGVVLDAAGMSDEEMLAIAAELGYSETAFLTGGGGAEREIRYFSPLAEVPFCGHATVATAVALAERNGAGDVVFQTRSGPVPVSSRRDDQGRITATLTSVAPHVDELDEMDLDEALAALGWAREELDPELPPRVAFAGAHHLVIGAATRERLADLDYDFDRLGALMAARDWTTVQLVWREQLLRFHSRNPFPPGGVVEDPATGAAAAAFGAYLRDLGLVEAPATVTILQGEDLGRPGRLLVDIHGDRPEIDVTGEAVPIE
ncbi:MAG TPA: PhzF family phenazine biosynthesis isomerase [Solirubrobacteraceae bacterium]|nr:PhzF family phenazine biosynthesis isomerase [Solirubrobacteraceae bacterium]